MDRLGANYRRRRLDRRDAGVDQRIDGRRPPAGAIHLAGESGRCYARNTGLDRAGGKYIAFFDSDDLWLPHHLQDCVESLDANADVDWVYGACRIVDGDSGQVLEDTTFYIDGRPRPFMNLSTRVSGQLRIIVDRNTVKTILAGDRLRCGLQNSVFPPRIRRPAIPALSIRRRSRVYGGGAAEACLYRILGRCARNL